MALAALKDGFFCAARNRVFTSSGVGLGAVQYRQISSSSPLLDASKSIADSPKQVEREMYFWGGATRKPAKVPDRIGIPVTRLLSWFKPGGTDKGFMGSSYKEPVAFPKPHGENVRQVHFGLHHHALVTEEGNVFTWGHSKTWELGHGLEEEYAEAPTKVEGLPPVKQVLCGEFYTIALTESGEVYTWGSGGSALQPGALGHGEFKDCPQPTKIAPFSDAPVVQIAAGVRHNLALTADGKLFTWGHGENGVSGAGTQLFQGVASSYNRPTENDFFKESKLKLAYIAAGANHCGAITEDGVLYTWGSNKAHQVGSQGSVALDLYACDPIPIQTPELDGEFIKQFAAGVNSSICVNDKYQVKEWGDHKNLTPRLVEGNDKFFLKKSIVQVASGNGFNACVDVNGNLYVWGTAGGGSPVPDKRRGYNPSPIKIEQFGPDKPLGRVERVFASNNNIAVITAK